MQMKNNKDKEKQRILVYDNYVCSFIYFIKNGKVVGGVAT